MFDHSKKFSLVLLFFSYFSFSHANPNTKFHFPPRGPNIESLAGNCNIGPFGRTGDIGQYKGYCTKLTNSEKCLAYIKQHISKTGHPLTAYDRAKAIFCLKSILSKIVE